MRNIETQDILRILHNYVVPHNTDSTQLRKAVIEFLGLHGIKRFLSKFDSSRQLLFMHYCLIYLKIYQPDCRFDINVTDRYPRRRSANDTEFDIDKDTLSSELNFDDDDDSNSLHLEGCVICRQIIRKGETISFLDGWLASLEGDVAQTFKGGTDFSIIQTTSNGNANLLLGPARFVNHDCNPNCLFSRKGRQISLRAIKDIYPGQELTVTYAENYFGDQNKECRCVTCEIRGVNGFGAHDADSADGSSDVPLTKIKRINRGVHRINSPFSPSAHSDPNHSEISRQSSLSPLESLEVGTPASSIEPDSAELSPVQSLDLSNDIPLKRRLRQCDIVGMVVQEDKLFKLICKDDANFFNAREEWNHKYHIMSKEDRGLYTFHDYIFQKLSELGRFKDLQRFYFSSPINADPDLTLDCVNCSTPFFAPDDDVAPRKLPTRMCPRCNRHAIVFNAYWPSIKPDKEKIELLRAWDFTSLKNIGVRGEFVPSDWKKKKHVPKNSMNSATSDVVCISEHSNTFKSDKNGKLQPLVGISEQIGTRALRALKRLVTSETSQNVVNKVSTSIVDVTPTSKRNSGTIPLVRPMLTRSAARKLNVVTPEGINSLDDLNQSITEISCPKRRRTQSLSNIMLQESTSEKSSDEDLNKECTHTKQNSRRPRILSVKLRRSARLSRQMQTRPEKSNKKLRATPMKKFMPCEIKTTESPVSTFGKGEKRHKSIPSHSSTIALPSMSSTDMPKLSPNQDCIPSAETSSVIPPNEPLPSFSMMSQYMPRLYWNSPVPYYSPYHCYGPPHEYPYSQLPPPFPAMPNPVVTPSPSNLNYPPMPDNGYAPNFAPPLHQQQYYHMIRHQPLQRDSNFEGFHDASKGYYNSQHSMQYSQHQAQYPPPPSMQYMPQYSPQYTPQYTHPHPYPYSPYREREHYFPPTQDSRMFDPIQEFHYPIPPPPPPL